MRATVRARLTIGFLALAAIGSVVSVAILASLSRSLDELRRVVTVSDVIEHKALEMRFDVLAMSDARRGFLISSADEAQRVRKEQAYEHFEVVVAEIRTLARQGEILGLLTAADMDARTLSRLEDGILATMASGDVEGATARYIAEYLPLRKKQESVIGDIEKETIRLKQVALSSAEDAYAAARATTWVLVVGVTGLGLGLSFLLARSLARPIVLMAASMARAAKGDLSGVLEFDARTDELGELSRTINGTYLYLREMSLVAGSLAAGDLRVRVIPRSDEDRLGKAFVATIERLSRVIGEVRKLAEESQSAAQDVGALASSSVSLAKRSGEVLGELVPSVRTADLLQAMGRVDEVTQHNASAAEELASTAEEMAAQAQALEELVALFQVDDRSRPTPGATMPMPGTETAAAPRVSLYLDDLARRRSVSGSAAPASGGLFRAF